MRRGHGCQAPTAAQVGIDKGFADLLREAAPFALGRALNYAEDVLTAPRVSPGVLLAERVTFTLDPAANDHQSAGEPPYGEGSQVTTYRYDAS